MRGINTIISHYRYRVDPKMGKCVCAILGIKCTCTAYVAQLDKYWLPNIAPSYQPMYSPVENCYYKKMIEHYNDWINIELLDNKITQVEFDNIHALILAVISTNKVELVQAMGIVI